MNTIFGECGNMFKDVFYVHQEIFDKFEPETEIEKMRNDVQAVIDGKKQTPQLRFISFKMTNYCNSNCEYCVHATGRTGEIKASIPYSIIERTLQDAKTLGCTAIAINGGESLMIPDVVKIVRATIANGIVPVLMTNALLLPEKWDELGEAGLRYIIISFDSLDKATYEKQRGASYEKALAGIEAALKLRQKYGNTEIFVSATLTENNFDDIVELIKYTTERKIKIQFSPFHNYLGDKGKDFKVNQQKIDHMVNSLLQMKKEGYLIASSTGFIEHFKDYFCKGEKTPEGYQCKMGFANLCIDAHMNVKVCWSKRIPPAGNLSEQSLIEIWNSSQMQESRRRMYELDCEGCWYMCTEITMLIDNKLFD